MANVTLSALIDKFLQESATTSDEKNTLREYLGLKTTDAVVFKSLTLTSPSANTSVLASTGFSLTGSSAVSLIDLAGTWNTTGAPAGIKLRVTGTAYALTAKLLDLQVGSYTAVRVGSYNNVGDYGTTLWLGSNGGDCGISVQGNVLFLGEGNNHNVQGPGFNFHRMGAGYGLELGSSAVVSLLGGTEAGGAGILQLGRLHATTPTAQTIKAHDVTTGQGASLKLAGGDGSNGKGSVFLDSNTRVDGNNFNNTEIFNALFGHGLVKPPLNDFSSWGSATSSSLEINLSSRNSSGAQWVIQFQKSTDYSTWTNAETSLETGDGLPATATISGLDPETTYYIRWRSEAQYNNLVFSDWSTPQSQSTLM